MLEGKYISAIRGRGQEHYKVRLLSGRVAILPVVNYQLERDEASGRFVKQLSSRPRFYGLGGLFYVRRLDPPEVHTTGRDKDWLIAFEELPREGRPSYEESLEKGKAVVRLLSGEERRLHVYWDRYSNPYVRLNRTRVNVRRILPSQRMSEASYIERSS